MIHLVTGVPGSGKSLHAVAVLLQELLKQSVKGPGGKMVPRRLLVDGITSLAIPHELMAPGSEGMDGVMAPAEGEGLWNWYEWAKPGDVLFIDEIQRWWRPRGNGVKPPPEIQKLETHRHMGVDFVVVTQSPMLIDQNVRRLVGRHTNVRRIFGMARAVLYEWDSCQPDVTRVATAVKRYWPYPKGAYKLYTSASLHTKQKFSIPLWLVIPLLAVVGGVFVVPKAASIMSSVMSGQGLPGMKLPGKPVEGSGLPVVASASLAPMGQGPFSVPPPRPPVGPPAGPLGGFVPAGVVVAKPALSGCIALGPRCSCLDGSGVVVPVEPAQCTVKAGADRGPAIDIGPDTARRLPVEVGYSVVIGHAKASKAD